MITNEFVNPSQELAEEIGAIEVPVPSPRTVAFAHQRTVAAAESERRKTARRRGYRGVFTRAELAAKAARASREDSER